MFHVKLFHIDAYPELRFDNMFQESLSEYTIQSSLYSLMLEDIGLKVIDRKLIWLKDDGTYEKITVPDISTILRDTL